MVAYDYALLRVVPRVDLGDGETVGVVLQARQARFLDLVWVTTPDALAARWPSLDASLLGRYLDALAVIVGGEAGNGPIGRLPPSERFHWLVATRSTVLQPSPVRTGLTADPPRTLAAIADSVRTC